MKDLNDRVKAVAEKLVERESAKKAILEKHKPKDGKKLTTEQRLARIEEVLGITQ